MKFFIDSHCHLSDERVFADCENLIQNAKQAGVGRVMIGGVNPAEWARQKSLLKTHPDFIRCSFGLHPWWVEKYSRAEIEFILQTLETEISHAHALGETGLDFHQKRPKAHFQDQEFAFRKQIEIAKKHQKPLVLHVVSAHSEAQAMIKEIGLNGLPIMIHSFSGSPEMAKQWIAMGAYLSFSGTFLKEGREKARHSLSLTPLDRILFETDSPDQAWRADGSNAPAFVSEVYQGAAKLLACSIEMLQEKVAENFAHFG